MEGRLTARFCDLICIEDLTCMATSDCNDSFGRNEFSL